MATRAMHADEIATDESLVSRLLTDQFPQWADLPVTRVTSSGTDNALYRLGDDLAVRLPRVPSAAGQVEKDQRWLPLLAQHLPLAVPSPLAVGRPGAGYPLTWGVYRWLDGAEATLLADPCGAARDLAGFLRALRRVDTSDGPAPRQAGRGAPLATRDRDTRQAIRQVSDEFAPERVTAAWEESLAAPVCAVFALVPLIHRGGADTAGYGRQTCGGPRDAQRRLSGDPARAQAARRW